MRYKWRPEGEGRGVWGRITSPSPTHPVKDDSNLPRTGCLPGSGLSGPRREGRVESVSVEDRQTTRTNSVLAGDTRRVPRLLHPYCQTSSSGSGSSSVLVPTVDRGLRGLDFVVSLEPRRVGTQLPPDRPGIPLSKPRGPTFPYRPPSKVRHRDFALRSSVSPGGGVSPLKSPRVPSVLGRGQGDDTL